MGGSAAYRHFDEALSRERDGQTAGAISGLRFSGDVHPWVAAALFGAAEVLYDSCVSAEGHYASARRPERALLPQQRRVRHGVRMGRGDHHALAGKDGGYSLADIVVWNHHRGSVDCLYFLTKHLAMWVYGGLSSYTRAVKQFLQEGTGNEVFGWFF